MRDFKKLEIWQRGHAFALTIYSVSNSFPKSEQFGLTNQIRRASTSIGANIAEGCGRCSQRDFLRFLFNSYSSVKECENFILLAKDLKYLDEVIYSKLSIEIEILSKMLNTFIMQINKDVNAQGSPPQAQS
ncbi:MAG: four helix bundle protein [Candidatus Micrarchaeota archaeon]